MTKSFPALDLKSFKDLIGVFIIDFIMLLYHV